LNEFDDIIFFKYTWDWRNEIHNCTKGEFERDSEEKELVEVDDYNKILKVYRLMKKYNQHLVKVHYKNEDESISHMLEWKDFDPDKMEVFDISEKDFTKYESNIFDIIKSKKAPGMFLNTTDDTRGSVMHKGKVDEGAIGDLLDKGLDGAMKRADQRQKNTGHAFSKSSKNRFIRRKKNGRRK
jgi:hypothetical protein